MSLFSVRSEKEEIMDDLECSGEVVDQTLRELEFINKWLGGNQVTLGGLDHLISKKEFAYKITIADLGCGSGEMLKLVHNHLNPPFDLQLLGVDANPHIIAYAEKNCENINAISFKSANILDVSFQQEKYDIIMATLFLHHFTNHQLIEIFKTLRRQARIGIVVNDLHRHPLAYYSIKFLTRLFSKSSMVKYDAPLSVLRGFRKNELVEILREAGILNYSLRWRWAFRWQIIIPA